MADENSANFANELGNPDSGGVDPTRPIGKGNPPRAGCFQKGHTLSRGERGPSPTKILQEAIQGYIFSLTDVAVKDSSGQTRKESRRRLDIIVQSLFQKASKGDERAIKVLFEYGIGRPLQQVRVSTPSRTGMPLDVEQQVGEIMENMTNDELDKFIKQIAAASAENAGGTGEEN